MSGKMARNRTCLAMAAILLVGWITSTAVSQDGQLLKRSPSGTWRKTMVLPAPEAHQAAAASQRFVFAIASRRIAKYERATGKKVAESRGEAEHLNSGFLWEGKLYCAHSNYPQTPERSQIKVLDTETMELTTFRDLGATEGV